MVEHTAESTEKWARMRLLPNDHNATARDALDLFYWFADNQRRMVDEKQAAIVVAVLARTGISPAERIELLERCLRSVMDSTWPDEDRAWKLLAQFTLNTPANS